MKQEIKDLVIANKDQAEVAARNVELQKKMEDLEGQLAYYKRNSEYLAGEAARMWGMWRRGIVRGALKDREREILREKEHQADREKERDSRQEIELRTQKSQTPKSHRSDHSVDPKSPIMTTSTRY